MQVMERDRCYVNPFVGEGRYARYLQNWLSVVPTDQRQTHDRGSTEQLSIGLLTLACGLLPGLVYRATYRRLRRHRRVASCQSLNLSRDRLRAGQQWCSLLRLARPRMLLGW